MASIFSAHFKRTFYILLKSKFIWLDQQEDWIERNRDEESVFIANKERVRNYFPLRGSFFSSFRTEMRWVCMKKRSIRLPRMKFTLKPKNVCGDGECEREKEWREMRNSKWGKVSKRFSNGQKREELVLLLFFLIADSHSIFFFLFSAILCIGNNMDSMFVIKVMYQKVKEGPKEKYDCQKITDQWKKKKEEKVERSVMMRGKRLAKSCKECISFLPLCFISFIHP